MQGHQQNHGPRSVFFVFLTYLLLVPAKQSQQRIIKSLMQTTYGAVVQWVVRNPQGTSGPSTGLASVPTSPFNDERRRLHKKQPCGNAKNEFHDSFSMTSRWWCHRGNHSLLQSGKGIFDCILILIYKMHLFDTINCSCGCNDPASVWTDWTGTSAFFNSTFVPKW